MSMTLKKGQKSFKPKFTARRPPTSARPSVEPRLSQTPTPATRPNEPITIPDQENDNEASQETSIVEPTPQGPILESSTQRYDPASDPANDAQSAENTSKRKASGENDAGASQKRARLDRSESRDIEMSESRVVQGPSSSTHIGDDASVQDRGSTGEDTRPSQNEMPQIDTVMQDLPTSENTSTSQPILETDTTAATTSTQAGGFLPDLDRDSNAVLQHSTSQNIPDAEMQPENAESTSRQPSPEIRQDNPMSVYPDPELSGIPLQRSGASGIVSSARLNPDGSTIGEIVPTVTLNPDGTPASNVVPAAALNPDGTPRELELPTKTKKKAVAKRRRLVQAAQAEGEDVRPTIEMQVNRPRRTAGAKRARKKKDGDKPRKKRGETPDNGEELEIDPAGMTMADLCKDLGIGAKSAQHERMKQKNEEIKQKAKERKAARLAKAAREAARLGGEEVSTVAETIEGTEDAEEENEADAAAAAAAAASPNSEQDTSLNPQMRIIDGRMVLDQATLAINKQKSQKRTARKHRPIIITEDDFSKIVTSGTHMQREPAQLWDARANATFYKGLSMFGYDFEMIAKMFPGRTRRSIKLKYGKEERDNPWKIKQIMSTGKVPIDMEELREYLQEPLASIEEIDGEIDEMKEAQKELEEEALRNREEIDRQKKAQLQRGGMVATHGARAALETMAEGSQGGTQASAAPRSGRAPKRPKKNLHGVRRDMDQIRETVISRGN